MVSAIGGVVRIGLPSPVYAFIVHALTDKAKPWFRFTRYLPSISLMGRRWPVRGDSCGAAGTGCVKGMSKILLAEDDTDMRRFLVKALQNAGFEVTSYDNGLSAYQRLREEPFELLLTDIVMPEMDGIELARRAAELDPDIKIMFITGFAAVALNADSTAPKQAKVLSKPIHLRELVTEVQKLLAA
jgi:two-component system cell cycle response regulator CpdR